MKKFRLNSFELHIIAMFCMLLDHIWATVVAGNNWMTCVGRIAFPIFAFLIVEGFTHTRSLKKYMLRLLCFALISEIPFNFMQGGQIFMPFHQNVLWTFLIALLMIALIDKVRRSCGLVMIILTIVFSVIVGYVLGFITMVDYYGYGVWMVMVFYATRDKTRLNAVIRCLLMVLINCFLMSGMGYDLTLFGHEFFLPQQSFAVLALIPIMLYNGEHGYYNKTVRWVYYLFYPVHMALLCIIGAFVG